MFKKRAVAAVLLCFFFFGLVPAYGREEKPESYYQGRASLVGYMLLQQLSAQHFSHKRFDQALSRAAFALYLKQLDPGKVFLLKSDTDKLGAYAGKINIEINNGNIELPSISAKLLAKRVERVREMVKEMLSGEMDLDSGETFETDAEKTDFCRTEKELKERWRKLLTYDVISQYLNLLAEREAHGTDKDAPKQDAQGAGDLRKTARERTLKGYEESFSRMLGERRAEKYDRYFSAIARAFDPHTEYMPPSAKEEFDISMSGAMEGIGAMLREENGLITVDNIMPGGPAAKQGQLMAGDILLKVAQGAGEPVPLIDMRVGEAVRLIRGKKGTEVRLTVTRQDGNHLVIPIVRDVVRLEDTFARGGTLTDAKNGHTFGYVKLPGFYRDFNDHGGRSSRNSTEDVRNEVRKLASAGIKGLILDLRNNGGGSLTDAVNIAGLFIRKGPVVQITSSSGNLKVLSDDDPSIEYKGPLVVLVNRFSASASEILAGSLQDYGRAVIVGSDHTYGKGTVQRLSDLNGMIPFNNMEKFRPLGALMLTIQKFYRISGESTQYRGVVPDIVLPDRLKGMKSGEQYLDHALPWDTVKPVAYTKLKLRPDIATLKVNSLGRLKESRDFIEIGEESARISELQKKTAKSLSIEAMKKEREEAKRMREKEARNFHGHGANPDSKPSDLPSSGEERKNFLIKGMAGDSYVKESMAVLADIVSATGAGAQEE